MGPPEDVATVLPHTDFNNKPVHHAFIGCHHACLGENVLQVTLLDHAGSVQEHDLFAQQAT